MSLFVASRLYELPSEEEKIIGEYLERVRKHVASHDLSFELVDDLESNLAEKLDSIQAKSKHTAKDIQSAISSLGEPEEVFAFEDAPSKSQKGINSTTIRSFFNRPWKRSQEDRIFFGVCGGIAQELEIDSIWVRILFILLTFASGFGILLYILLIFLMEKNPETISTEARAFAAKVSPEIREISQKMKDKNGSFMQIFDRIWELIIRTLSAIFWLGAFALAVGLVALIGITKKSLIIANMDVGSVLPQTAYFALFSALACAFFLLICFLARMVWRRSWTIISFAIILGLLLLTIGLGMRSVTEGFAKYNTEASTEFSTMLTGAKDGTYLVRYTDTGRFYSLGRNIEIVTSSDTATGSIEIQSKITGWGSSGEEVMKALAHFVPVRASLEGETLVLSRTGTLFDQAVLFVFPREHITITAPPGITIESDRYRWRLEMWVSEGHDYGIEYNDLSIPKAPTLPALPR